ncbi:polysaccharide pyruvyl transferase family protein [Arthrobacter gengyunqii]|uniref:Polysaccharide pyruvyl transferase family protein n=1 Tax=Arthrobacter gengyunqii TaxID=2886940 RepID=A0A9X1M1V4_9MICC|nr:polysaccharide pyruvyl transferase family protein [Arthrobacter gengyunqii]MCC3269888.1 polysaccharide pyruvyl transferase family protein [Arthrobacter gengyunqii]UOY95180.1 polysaccharide pyruvyl transferase family protein [Arthrobacter gengyunqii]
MTVGVMGCVRELPSSFPVGSPENAGNMIHGNAPFEMFPDLAVHSTDRAAIKASGSRDFVDFVNSHCSHLVLTMANTLRLGDENGSRFSRLQHLLEAIEKPVVVFGLGVQSQTDDLSGATLPEEAVSLMQHLSTRAEALGVRGSMTKTVLEELCGVRNAFITGCPSLFSRPAQLAKVAQNLREPSGRPAFSGTKYHLAEEKFLLHQAVSAGFYLMEPVNKFNHKYFVDVSKGVEGTEAPYFLRSHEMHKSGVLSDFFARNYKLFRNVNSWYDFNSESVSHTYGTRFHVNMASILSGKPALWITHDARTRELVDFMHLPSLTQEECLEMEPEQIIKSINYDDFFDHINGLFDNFNSYLDANGLPKTPSLVR